MKTFLNKKTEITQIDDKEKKTNLGYADLCLLCVRSAKEGGFGVEEMRKRFRLIDALDGIKDNAVVKLEDADAALLDEIMQGFRWAVLHKDIIALTDHVHNLETVK